MKETALTSLHAKAGARMVEYAGYSMPVEFAGVIKENLATRTEAGLFDVSHMGEFWVKGENALPFLQYVTTNDIAKLEPGKAQYSCFPNGKGGIVDDLIVYHYSDEKYMLVVNGANIQKDWDWLNKQNSFEAELENASNRISMMALQGPKAIDILSPLVSIDLKNLKPFEFVTTQLAGIEEVILSATGYTGAGGFEIYCYNHGVAKIWDMILKAGEAYSIQSAGLASRDTLRLEMGYPLYGNDIDDTTSPMEAGLSWIVKLNKNSDFIDKELYSQQKADGVTKKLIAFELLDRGIPRKDYSILNSEEAEIGRVTSGTQSPNLNKGIGLGYVKTGFSQPGNEILIQVRNKKLKAKIVKLPFINN